jgi:hypothetical protein
VYGALRVRDGKELTRCAASRNSKNYIAFLADIEVDNPTGDIYMITDNLEPPQQCGDAHLARSASTAPSPLHSDRSLLAQYAGRLVAALPPRCGFLAKALPTLTKSGRPPVWRRLNSTIEPSPGSGDARPRLSTIVVASFVTAFKEQSTGAKR